MITGLQTELNKISGLKTGVSGLSLGGRTGAAHRFAVHEVEIGDPYHTAGSYMYGMGLYVGSTVGTAFWGGTLAALPDQGSGTGTAPHLFIQNNGLVGVNTTAPGYTLDITGDIRATGVVYGSVKSFDIAHPDLLSQICGYVTGLQNPTSREEIFFTDSRLTQYREITRSRCQTISSIWLQM